MGNRAKEHLTLRALVATQLFSQAAMACEQDRALLRGDWGRAQFSVEVADEPAERSLGLMNRPAMDRFAGMLFVYEHPQQVAFWMKNTLIPLDLLFADDTGTVIRVHENAIPGDLTAIPGGGMVQYVLEINGGLARTLGISQGSQLQHPAITQDSAAWPCESSE